MPEAGEGMTFPRNQYALEESCCGLMKAEEDSIHAGTGFGTKVTKA